jgi:hypothetical protein
LEENLRNAYETIVSDFLEMDERPKALVCHCENLYRDCEEVHKITTRYRRIMLTGMSTTRQLCKGFTNRGSKSSLKDKIRYSLIFSRLANPKLAPWRMPEALKGYLRASCGSVRDLIPKSLCIA